MTVATARVIRLLKPKILYPFGIFIWAYFTGNLGGWATRDRYTIAQLYRRLSLWQNVLNTVMTLADLVADLYQRDLKILPRENRFEGHDYTHFDHESRNSDHLLVCLGDSWTKGDGLEPNMHTDVFGAQLSRELGWDWLNCGGGGMSNSWILNYCEYLIDHLNASDYQSGAIVLTFTENSRDIPEYNSRPFDYISAYRSLPVTTELYDMVLDDIEKEWTIRLNNICHALDGRFQIIAGCNFAWHSRLIDFCVNHDRIQWINSRWLDLLAIEANKAAPHMIRLVHVEYLALVNQIIGLQDKSAFKLWFVKHSDPALALINWMANTPEFFEPHDTGHPNAKGHRIWADAIKRLLTTFADA